MTGKRFTTDNGSHEDVCLVDNLTKKEYESNFNDIVDLMNDIWKQTKQSDKKIDYLKLVILTNCSSGLYQDVLQYLKELEE